MPYIGRDLNRGNYLKLDDISSSFNSSTKTFNLTVGGSAFTPGSAFSILVSVGGVIQEPESAYQVNNSEITFANAPTAQDSFFCIALGVSLGIGVPGNGTVNGTQMAKPFNYDGFFYLNDGTNRVGINSSSPTVALDVVGDVNVSGNISGIGGTLGGTLIGNVYASSGISTFNDVLVNGNLTVEGDTTTLNTTLRNVELLRVSAASTLPAGIITQTNTGDILSLYDDSSEVFKVADGGAVTLSSTIDVTGQSTFRDRLQIVDSTPEILLSVPSGGLDSRILNDGSGKLIIGHGTNSDTPTERVGITTDGDVTITGYDNAELKLKSGNANADGFLAFINNAGITSGRIAYDHQYDKFTFNVGGTGTGTEKLRITSSGAVGINTTVDAATKLQVQSDGTSTTVGGNVVARFQSNGSGRDATIQLSDNVANSATISMLSSAFIFKQSGTETLRISSSGNVSIGDNATPDTLLHLQGDKPKLRIESTNALEASAGTEEIGRIEFEAKKGSNINVAASLRVRQDGTWSTVDDWFSPTAIEFYTQDQSGTEITTPRLIINSTGKVGIGTDNPGAILDARGNVQFGDGGGFDMNILGTRHQFSINGDEKVRITSGGNVNIGTGETTQTARMLNVYGGATRVTQTSGGNTVEVFGHTTSGQSYGLLVNAGSTSGDYCANFRNSSGTALFRIRGDGKVGVGTDLTSSTYKFEVWDDTAATLMIRKGNASRIVFSNDSQTNTLYSQALPSYDAREFSVYMGSSEAIRIGVNGGVGIGTNYLSGNTAVYHKLMVEGDTTSQIAVAKILRRHSSASNGTYTLEVDSSSHTSNVANGGAMSVDVNSGRAFTINGYGRVGIGTDSPASLLQVGDSLVFNGTELYPTSGIGTNVGHRLNYRRNAPQSRTNTGSAAQQYYKIGEIVLNGSESAEINIYGTQGYSNGTECAGKTTIVLRATNGNTLAGFWYEETLGNANLSDVRWKFSSGQTYELWVKASTYANIAPFVRCTGNGFTSFNEATGDGSAPAGSTAFSTYHRKTIGGVATIRYNPTDTTFHRNIKMDSTYGIHFHDYDTGADIDSNLLADYEEGTFTPTLYYGSGTSEPSYSWRYGQYTKIGKQVTIWFNLGITGFSATYSEAYIGGLPFQINDRSATWKYVSEMWGYSGASGYGSGVDDVNFFIAAYDNQTKVMINQNGNHLSTGMIGSGQRFSSCFTYFTD